jgi:dihydrofolate synthase/folylpolyglutamate synthase
MKIANFAEATEILNGFIPRPLDIRAVYNLDTIYALANFLNNPQDAVQIIHVAGTSGKTSTAYYAAALLRAAGKKVGLTVSPHITEINERVQINLTPLPEDEFCQELGIFMDEVTKSKLTPTYFELMMAFAYWEFARQKVDYAVVEVGLGGLLDGSNIVTRADKVCVITDIGLDHMNVLGSTIAEIAAQKAGIIHADNDVFMHQQPPEVTTVITEKCAAVQAHLHTIAPNESEVQNLELPLYQQRNMGLAAAAVEFALARNKILLSAEHIQEAANVHIPGRMEVLHIGEKTIVLDGAHNPQKLQAMVDSMHVKYPDEPVAALVGFVQSKEVSLHENAEIISDVTQNVIVTSFGAAQENGRPSIDSAAIMDACRAAGIRQVTTVENYTAATEALLQSPESLLLVTGSLYLISYIRPLLMARTITNQSV